MPQAEQDIAHSLRRLRRAILLSLLVCGAVVLAGWALAGALNSVRQQNRQHLQEERTASVAQDVHNLFFKTHADSLCRLCESPAIRDVASGKIQPNDPSLQATLETARKLLGAAMVYYVESDGMVTASAAPPDVPDYRGINVAYRPYFKRAMGGEEFAYGAVGQPTGRRGMYFSSPVSLADSKHPVGVLVVKVEFDELERRFREGPLPAYLESPEGVILAASERDWVLRSIGPLSAATTQQIKNDRQFAGRVIEPLPFPFDQARGRAVVDGRAYTLLRQPVGQTGWAVVTFQDAEMAVGLTAAQRMLLWSRGSATVALLVIIALLTLTIRRRRKIEAALRISRAAADAARQEAEAARATAEAAQAAAEHANAAKDRFLAVLSHELRTPLTPVLARVSELEADETLPGDHRETFALIRRNVEQEARLIDDLLDLTRVARGKLAIKRCVVDAHAIVTAVADAFEAQAASKGLALRLELGAAEHHVLADSSRLQQVLSNLLQNALKFTAAGSVTIRTRNDGAEPGNGRVGLIIDVADTGIGIEPEVVERLFYPFEQGNGLITRQFGGLGLGLSISRAMVHAHGGVLSAASEGRDRGSTFSVRLPVVAAPATAPDSPSLPEVPDEAPPTGLRVLLVEDHPDTSYVMARILTRMGYMVTAAAGVPEALRAVEAACAAGEPFDLLLSDLSLPDGSGLDLLHEMRRMCGQEVPAVSVSGFGMEEDLRRSQEAGFAVHLTKPVTLEQLEAALRVTLRGVATGADGDRAPLPVTAAAGG